MNFHQDNYDPNCTKKNPQRNTLGSHFYGEKLAKKTYKNCITYALLGPVRLPSTFTFHATDLNKKNSSVEFWSIATKTCNPYLEG